MLGKFIVFEGIDGAGKSSCVLKLVEYLNKNHCPTLHTYEPHANFITDTINDVLYDRIPDPDSKIMATLFTASRMHHIEQVIKPALAQNLNVVSDRYIFSTLAYNVGKNTTKEYIELIHKEFYIAPDHIFYLSCSPIIAYDRLKEHKKNKSINDTNLEKIRTVYSNYNNFFGNCMEVTLCEKTSLLHIIDATISQYEVFKQVKAIINTLIQKPLPISQERE